MVIEHCSKTLSRDNMQVISAPYNFVPLNERVHIPSWHRQVSHDWPFQDGLSGVIEYTLTADSPILVGGHQTPGTTNQAGQVRPFKLPDGCYAIPGSSFKGMLRSVVEIIGYGRMRMVDDQRPGLRDITGRNVSASYADKVRNRVQTGFLCCRPDAGQEILPCSMIRVSHRELESALEARRPIFRARTDVCEKYRVWNDLCRRKRLQPDEICFDVGEEGAINLVRGSKKGFPVFTGQISDSTRPRGKYKDFIFYDADESSAIPVSDEAWRDFLFIHGDEDDKPGMSWPGYWKQKYRNGEPVPVFYVLDKGFLRIGLAYMPKLAGDFSIHEVISHASGSHLEEPGKEKGYDLADLLFGAIGESQPDALRGRVSCEAAVALGNPEPEEQDDTILNGPKPTYFPNYIQQKTRNGGRLSGGQYATYMQTPQQGRPVIRGFKRYPARPDEQVGVQKLNQNQINNKKVQVCLHPLPAGTKFKGRVLFHNLKPEELGALLWAMTWGGDQNLRHGLGMGKSFGFGQVRFCIDSQESDVMPNDPDQVPSLLDEGQRIRWMEIFATHMEGAINKHDNSGGWLKGERMSNLMAMADSQSAKNLPTGMELRHMCLNADARINEFTWAKQNSLVLADYAGASRWQARLEKRQEELRKQRRVTEEAERNKAEQAAKEKEKEKFDALPAYEKLIHRMNEKLEAFPVTGKPLPANRFRELLAIIRSSMEQAREWDETARMTVADAIENWFNRLGWTPGGLKKPKREKQEKNRREELETLRKGNT